MSAMLRASAGMSTATGSSLSIRLERSLTRVSLLPTRRSGVHDMHKANACSALVALIAIAIGTMALWACSDTARAIDDADAGDRVCLSDRDCFQTYFCDVDGRCRPGASVARQLDAGFDGGAPSSSDVVDHEVMSQWGTIGARDFEPKSPGGHAYCAIGDVRSDDLGAYYDAYIPEAYSLITPWPDTPGRCGDDLETLSWRLMNCERMSRGLDPVSCDLRLVWAGRRHSENMLRDARFDHTDRLGMSSFDRLAARGIEYTWAGENLAMFSDVQSAHQGWMDSASHRRNVLNDQYSFGGIGTVAAPGNHLLYLTGLYIRP